MALHGEISQYVGVFTLREFPSSVADIHAYEIGLEFVLTVAKFLVKEYINTAYIRLYILADIVLH